MEKITILKEKSFNPRRDIFFSIFVLLLSVPVIFAVATREAWVGTDTQNYLFFFQKAHVCGCIPEEMEFLFSFLAWIVGLITSNSEAFFGFISAIQFFLALTLAIILSRHLHYQKANFTFCLFFIAFLLASPFFLSMQVNILRQGTSAFFVAISTIFFHQKKFFSFLIFGLMAIGFHYSALLYIAFIPLLNLSYKNIRIVFFSLSFLYLTGFSEQLVRGISDVFSLPIYQFLADYGSDSDYRAGIRFDFYLFSIFPWIFLYFFQRLDRSDLNESRINRISAIYLVLLMPFLIFGWTAYSDRYALGAWLLIPVFATLALMRLIGSKYRWVATYFLIAAMCIFIFRMSSADSWQ